MEDGVDIWVGDMLLTIYDVAMVVFHYSKKPSSTRRKQIVQDYAVAVRNLWVKSFTENHVVHVTTVKRRIEYIMKDYEYKVRTSHSHHKSSTLRARNRNWMNMDVPQPKTKKAQWCVGCKNSSLFDIGKNIETSVDDKGNVIQGLTGVEKVFYEDQKGERKGKLSQEIDLEFAEEQMSIQAAMIAEEAEREDEISFINEDLEVLSQSQTESRRAVPVLETPLMVHKDIQVDLVRPTEPVRLVRNSNPKILDTIAAVSSAAGVSVAKARIATREVCKRKYNDIYELEVAENPDSSVKKKPRKAEDYKAYAYVLPSDKSVNNFKHKKAITQEVIAAKALHSKKATTKVTLHYDTTTRSRIDGDWPSLIFNFKDDDPLENRMISLRPIKFAYENRDQIISLIVETLQRLSVAASKLKVSASDLWEKVDAIMTDSVTKNLKIEEGVAEALQSKHIPYHILCKSHTCERMDSDNLATLSELETKIGLRELLIKREPLLKSFLRSKKSVVEAALEALLKLVAVDGDGKTTSLADQFALKLEEAGTYKTFSLYKEKRFTRLGYQAGAVYDCVPYFRAILDETPLNNLLVRSCRIYLENDFVLAGLKALALFTYNITMPFLNLVEKSDQETLVDVLPKLCSDLAQRKTDTLSRYKVEWTHVHVVKNGPESELDQFLLEAMCEKAAIGVELQCKREYWSDENDTTATRATKIHLLTPAERANLPTNNLRCERYLAKFGYLAAQSAAHSNKCFTGKRIRDDLVLSDANDDLLVDCSIIKVMKLLDDMELKWSASQKELKKKHLLEGFQKKVRANDFVDQLLGKCKQHHGPFTSVNEVKTLVQQNPKELKSFLRLEIQYQRVTHPRDAEARKDIYRVNKVTLEEMIENLVLILSDENEAQDCIVFPSEEEIMEKLQNKEQASIDEVTDETTLVPNQPVAIIWDTKKRKQWYIGFFLNMNDDGTFRVDHLERDGKLDKRWVRPRGGDDIQDAEEVQILPTPVSGDWIFTEDRPIFVLNNEEQIHETFDVVCTELSL